MKIQFPVIRQVWYNGNLYEIIGFRVITFQGTYGGPGYKIDRYRQG